MANKKRIEKPEIPPAVMDWMRATGAEGGRRAAESLGPAGRLKRATKASKAAAKARTAKAKEKRK